jgi:ABC-type transport system involved in multi-copper enzyme maturation permease subunit
MLFSLWVGKTHEALLLTYAVWLLWLLTWPMLGALYQASGWSFPNPTRFADPFWLVLAPVWYPRTVDWSDYLCFAVVTCAISVALVLIAIARVRTVCTRVSVRRPSRMAGKLRSTGFWRQLARTIPCLSPSVDRNPIAWREWTRSRPTRWSAAVILLYAGISLGFSILAATTSGAGRTAAFVNGFQVAIGLLLLSVTAATSLAEERVRGSLDLLMSTSLSTREILLGKWLGVYRAVPLLAILPTALVGTLAYEMDAGLGPPAKMCVYMLCAGAAITSLGLAMATRFSRLGHAVGMTVSLYFLITVGWFFLMLYLQGPAGEPLAMFSPFMWAAELAFEVAERNQPDRTAWMILSTVLTAWVAVELLMSTLGDYDRRLGRIDDALARLVRPSTALRIMNAISLPIVVFLGLGSGGPYQFSLGATMAFTLVTVLAVGSAAASPRGEGVGAALGRTTRVEIAPGRTLVLKWLLALRVMLPGMIVALFMVIVRVERIELSKRAIAILVGYVVTSAAMASSLGVAVGCGQWRTGWRIVVAIVLWFLICTAYAMLGWGLIVDSFHQGLSMSSPFYGLWTLALAVTNRSTSRFDALSCAIRWSIAFAVVTALLLLGAVLAHRPRVTRLQPGP